MRARVDPTKCQGYGICVELAPHHFVADDWGIVQAVQVDADGEHRDAVTRAVQQCPIKAIRWIDAPPTAATTDPASGKPLHPTG
jgi:ferredoxin